MWPVCGGPSPGCRCRGRLVLAVGVSPWLRPNAGSVPDRSFCHTYGRGNAKHQMLPGWPYSVVVALETGRTSWSALLDAVRLAPGADLAAVTACQVREVVERLIAAGQWTESDPDVLVVLDAGYDASRIAHLLSGQPVEVLGRARSDRVMRRPAPSREEFFRAHPKGGRMPKHGGEFVFGGPATWGEEQAVTFTGTRLYGKATSQAWDRLHPWLTQRAAWLDHDGPLPVIEGTVIRLTVEHLPSSGVNKQVWLWWSRTSATPADVDHCWQAFLRRFDTEHTFRMLKQILGWTRPRVRDSAAADRWTWLIIAAHTELRLAGPLATDLRRRWEKLAPPHKLTPAGVRFRPPVHGGVLSVAAQQDCDGGVVTVTGRIRAGGCNQRVGERRRVASVLRAQPRPHLRLDLVRNAVRAQDDQPDRCRNLRLHTRGRGRLGKPEPHEVVVRLRDPRKGRADAGAQVLAHRLIRCPQGEAAGRGPPVRPAVADPHQDSGRVRSDTGVDGGQMRRFVVGARHLPSGHQRGHTAEGVPDVGDDGGRDSRVPHGGRAVPGAVDDGRADRAVGALDVVPVGAGRFGAWTLRGADFHVFGHVAPRCGRAVPAAARPGTEDGGSAVPAASFVDRP